MGTTPVAILITHKLTFIIYSIKKIIIFLQKLSDIGSSVNYSLKTYGESQSKGNFETIKALFFEKSF